MCIPKSRMLAILMAGSVLCAGAYLAEGPILRTLLRHQFLSMHPGCGGTIISEFEDGWMTVNCTDSKELMERLAIVEIGEDEFDRPGMRMEAARPVSGESEPLIAGIGTALDPAFAGYPFQEK